jgi:predicted DNA-binding transcriptional regulator AlpA
MAQQAALPRTLSPRLISRAAAAAYIDVSPTTFDAMVRDNKMPRPKLLGGRRKAWDVRALDDAVDSLPSDGNDVADETWNNIDGP